jgi:predicted 3-demethylubiquinone-9 3-methyltransferase (glyoxalase superfamily)
MKKIIPCLWFNNQAEEAAHFYASIFPNSKIGKTDRYDAASAEVSGQPEGSVLTVEFELDGNPFLGLNGGPLFKFSEATSFMVECNDQAEIDHYWSRLSAVPESEQCGWLKDQFGVSWQIVPKRLNELLRDPDKAKAARAMQAMLQMKKLDIAELDRAAQG